MWIYIQPAKSRHLFTAPPAPSMVLASVASSDDDGLTARIDLEAPDAPSLSGEPGARASLTDLDLSWTEVGDEGVLALFRGCSALKLLAVQGCKALTPRCVRGLFEEGDTNLVAAPALQWIDFSWVNTMSVTLAEAVLRARPELAVVDYYGDLLKGSQCELEFKRSPT